jgi:hypothetical protein
VEVKDACPRVVGLCVCVKLFSNVVPAGAHSNCGIVAWEIAAPYSGAQVPKPSGGP